MKLVQKILDKHICAYDKYAYFRLAYGRGAGHIGILSSMYAKIPEFLLIIKVFNIKFIIGIIIAILLMIGEVALMFWIGHVDLQNNLMSKDISLANKYNPEIQKLLKR